MKALAIEILKLIFFSSMNLLLVVQSFHKYLPTNRNINFGDLVK